MTDFIEINLQHNLQTLRQQLKKSIVNNPVINLANENFIREWKNEISDSLSSNTKKNNLKQDKNKKKKKKSKKQLQQQKMAIQELKSIFQNILFYEEKSFNIKKNLIKISDKIESSQMVISIFTPIFQSYIKETIKQNIPIQVENKQSMEFTVKFFSKIKQNLFEIEQVFDILIENVSQTPIVYLFEKSIFYLFYNKPELLKLMVYMNKNIKKTGDFINPLIKKIVQQLPDIDQLEIIQKIKDKNIKQKVDKKQEVMNEIELQEQQKAEKLIRYIQNMTFKEDRIKVNLDPTWFNQFLKRNNKNCQIKQ